MTNIDHILLFKTNISSFADKQALKPVLDGNSRIKQWNIDLNDCDYVLRIESDTLSAEQVIHLINHHGFECSELL